MTKKELRTMIQEVIQEEIASGNLQAEQELQEDVETAGYIIKAWENPGLKDSSNPAFDSEKAGNKYPDFDAVLAALSSEELSGLGAYEITWVPTKE